MNEKVVNKILWAVSAGIAAHQTVQWGKTAVEMERVEHVAVPDQRAYVVRYFDAAMMALNAVSCIYSISRTFE